LANQSTLLLNYSTPPTPLVNSMVTANSKAQTLCLQGDPTLSPALNPNINFLQHRFPSIRILQAPFPGTAIFSPRPQHLLVLLLFLPLLLPLPQHERTQPSMKRQIQYFLPTFAQTTSA
jgi:hypothetical protein